MRNRCSDSDETEEERQQVIENGCKMQMFWAAQDSLNEQQLKIAKNTQIKQPLHDDKYYSFQCSLMLCQICEILTDDQMKNISACFSNFKWPHKTLYDWYDKHRYEDSI